MYGEEVVHKGQKVKKITRSLNRNADEWSAENAEYHNMMRGLSFPVREQLHEDVDMASHHSDDDEHPDPASMQLPSGEEGMLSSYAGGELEYHTLLTSTLEHSNRRGDDCTCEDWVKLQNEYWEKQKPHILRAYLAFKAFGALTTDTGANDSWTITTMDFHFTGPKVLSHPDGSRTVNESLAWHGFLGGSPEQPTIAFSFSLFEIYRQIHCVCPKFSVDGLARSLQYIHLLLQASHLEDQLRFAWDAYLGIMHDVEELMLSALSRDNHTVYNEMLSCIDGNSSLKLFDAAFKSGKQRKDTCQLINYWFMEKAEVNRFADEVWNAQKKSGDKDIDAMMNPQGSDMPFLSAEESHELHSCVNTCVEWWKAAGPESCKQMFALFAISGIFVATCCHGHILVLCDMTHSSESRMKYPLAVINNLIDRFGEDLGVAYDIMCAFFKTLLHSAKLRDKVIDNRLVGNFIYQNYRQALDRLLKDGPLLEEICEQRGISCDDCEQFLASERDYFNTEFEDPLELTIKMDYAELLQKLWAAKVQSDDAHLKFQSLQRDEGKNLSEKEKSWIEVRNRTTHQFYEIIEEEVADFEVEHGIVKRWKESFRRFASALMELGH
uniref:Uncharacterized protein n=1 Tax=Moniliophthora roreri TaxID=221103 RepID=A0A0W0G254_MONRR